MHAHRQLLVVLRHRRLGVLQQLGDFVAGRRAGRAAGRLHQMVDELLDLALRHRPHEAVDRPAAEEGVDRRDRLDAKLLGQHLVLVDVDLDQLHLALGFLHHLLDGGLQGLAGAAPGRPEIDDDRRRTRGFEHVLGEFGLVAVLDQIGRGRGHGGSARHHRFHSASKAEMTRVDRNVAPAPL